MKRDSEEEEEKRMEEEEEEAKEQENKDGKKNNTKITNNRMMCLAPKHRHWVASSKTCVKNVKASSHSLVTLTLYLRLKSKMNQSKKMNTKMIKRVLKEEKE